MIKRSVLAVAAVAVTLAGCYGPRNVGGVRSLGIVETAPVESDKGYVEFISVSRDVPVPVYQVDDKGNAYLLASVGLRPGDVYHRDRYGHVVQNLRVSEPPGEQTFAIERNGERIEVPVKEGKITPVEVDYTLLQDGDAFRTYRVNYRVFEPVPYQEGRLSSAASSSQEQHGDQRAR
jgi:hypothetical protein